MSYLIALYVYYHGNNLAVFGVTKGARDEDLDNSGLKRPTEINPDLVPQQLIESAIQEEEKIQETNQALNYAEMMKEAIIRSQQETYSLYNAKMIGNTIYDKTAEANMEEYDEEVKENEGIVDEMNRKKNKMQ